MSLRSPVRRPTVRRLFSGVEHHPVLAVCCVALAVRVTFAFAVMAFHRGVLIPDEQEYLELARLASRGQLTKITWGGYGLGLYRSTATFTRTLTWLFWVFGPSKILGQLLAAFFGAVTAALTTGLALEAMGRRWALAAGFLVALMPSQILWSSVTLRESMIWAALVWVALCFAVAGREGQALRVSLALAGMSIGLLALGDLRAPTFVAVVWAVGVAVWTFRPQRAGPVRVATLALVVVLPLISGQGLAGWSLVRRAVPALGLERATLASNADSAFVPAQRAQSGGLPATLTDEHGRVFATDNSLGADLSALPRGLVAVTVRPFAWDHGRGLGLALAKVENVAWLGLYLLAAVGLVVGLNHRRVFALPMISVAAIVCVEALASGNLGTAFRHRAQILWALALFVAMGTRHLSRQVPATRSRRAAATSRTATS